MPIEGYRQYTTHNIPVFKDGQRTEVDPVRVRQYSLEAAQELVRVVRSSLEKRSYQFHAQLIDQIEHLEEFARAAGEVVDASHAQVNELQTKKRALHSQAPAEKFDAAIAKLEINLQRHARMQRRIQETVSRAHRALALWSDSKKHQIMEPNSHPKPYELLREIDALKRGERKN